MILFALSSGSKTTRSPSSSDNQISHWIITEPNSLEENQSHGDDRVEICEGFENRQEFNGSLTKRIPVPEELSIQDVSVVYQQNDPTESSSDVFRNEF